MQQGEDFSETFRSLGDYLLSDRVNKYRADIDNMSAINDRMVEILSLMPSAFDELESLPVDVISAVYEAVDVIVSKGDPSMSLSGISQQIRDGIFLGFILGRNYENLKKQL